MVKSSDKETEIIFHKAITIGDLRDVFTSSKIVEEFVDEHVEILPFADTARLTVILYILEMAMAVQGTDEIL